MKKKIISKPVLVGIFTVTVLSLTYFGVNYLKSRRIFSNDNIIYAVFPQADGLEVSAPVLIKGFRIGTVDKITFNINTAQVQVKMIVNGEYPLPINSTAEISSASILGGKVLEVSLGDDDVRTLVSGDTIKAIYAPGLTESLGQEYGKLKSTATEIVNKFNKVLEGLNKVLSDENTQSLQATLTNLRSISENLDQVISGEKQNIENVVANLAALSASFKRMTPDIERGVKNLALLSDTLAVKAPSLIANANGSVENLNRILHKIDSGEGTMGKLVTDEQLYDNLGATISSLNLLLQDLKANPKRYINVTVFGKKEKAEKK